MNVNSLRADGWGDVAFLLIAVMSAVFFWYINGFYLNWLVFVAGIGAGVIVHRTFHFADNHPVAGFPVTMVLVLALVAAVHSESLVAGAVSALTITTAIKVYEVYLSS